MRSKQPADSSAASASSSANETGLRALLASLRRDPAFAAAREQASLSLQGQVRRYAQEQQVSEALAWAACWEESMQQRLDRYAAEAHYATCSGCGHDAAIDRRALVAVRAELFSWLALLAGHTNPEGFLASRLRHLHPRLLMLLAEAPPDMTPATPQNV